MRQRISPSDIEITLKRALATSAIDAVEDSSAVFYDLSFLKERAKNLRDLFPADCLHAVAVKANPLVGILEVVCQAGLGAEAASLPEVRLAEAAGFPADRIVFDSPAKTRSEIEYALKQGIHINADSLSELDSINQMLDCALPKGTVGVRINPQIGEGKDKFSSTAGEYSKFGVPIKQFRADLLQRFKNYRWLTGLHLHIGSQTIGVPQLIAGIKVGLGFAEEINAVRKSSGQPALFLFDLGGGLPVTYREDETKATMAEYRGALAADCPGLFSGGFKLITEFGRYIHSPSGWAISRVESVKRDFLVHGSKVHTATIHLGADMFLRKCYNPEKWHHDLFVFTPEGELKSGSDSSPYKVVGPLCFSGDIIADNINLPPIESGDWIAIRDTGAYTLGMWSRYNSRQIPKVLGYEGNGESFTVLRQRESIEDLVRFWSVR